MVDDTQQARRLSRRPSPNSIRLASPPSTRRKIARLIANPAIVRNRLKIESAVTNAKAFLAVQKRVRLASTGTYGHSCGGKPLQNRRRTLATVPARTEQSDALSKDLQKRGFRFVGTTIIYAFMQATGLVNDHLVACPRWAAVQTDRGRR